MVFSLSRLLLLSLSATSALARLPPHARAVRDVLPVPGAVNPTKRGYISVTSDADKSLNGYVAARPNPSGTYGLATGIQSAIHVSFCPDDASGSRPFNLYVAPPDDTSDSDFPFLGAVQGEARYPPGDLTRDPTLIANCANLVRTPETPSGPAVLTNSSETPRQVALRYGESRIWTTNREATPMSLIPVWTNRDGNTFSYSWIYGREDRGVEWVAFEGRCATGDTVVVLVNLTFFPTTGSEASHAL